MIITFRLKKQKLKNILNINNRSHSQIIITELKRFKKQKKTKRN
jgi:hypothetical protein